MRDVFLVRHGKAVAAAPGGDAARPLTDDGKREIASVARALAAFGAVPTAVWHSPYVRAHETAQILSRGLSDAKLVVEQSLAPSASAARAMSTLVSGNERCLVAVSHMPLLPELVQKLTGANVDFGTGTVAHLVFAGGDHNALVGLWSADKLALVR